MRMCVPITPTRTVIIRNPRVTRIVDSDIFDVITL